MERIDTKPMPASAHVVATGSVAIIYRPTFWGRLRAWIRRHL